jgi:hypothetical protein
VLVASAAELELAGAEGAVERQFPLVRSSSPVTGDWWAGRETRQALPLYSLLVMKDGDLGDL